MSYPTWNGKDPTLLYSIAWVSIEPFGIDSLFPQIIHFLSIYFSIHSSLFRFRLQNTFYVPFNSKSWVFLDWLFGYLRNSKLHLLMDFMLVLIIIVNSINSTSLLKPIHSLNFMITPIHLMEAVSYSFLKNLISIQNYNHKYFLAIIYISYY